MADLKRCTTCGALTLPDDVKFHAADHAHYDRRLNELTRLNQTYLQDIAGLRDDIRSYGRQLEDHPISMAPEGITVTDAPEFDPDDLLDPDADDDDYVTTSTYADDNVTATIADPTAGEPAESGADVIYPAIDRDDNITPTTAAIRQIHTIDLA